VREPGDARLHPVSGSGLVVDIMLSYIYVVPSIEQRAAVDCDRLAGHEVVAHEQ